MSRGIWLLEATEYAPALSPRHADLYIPQVHYAVPLWGDPLSAVTLTLQVRIKGSDEQDLRKLWNDLIGLLWNGSILPANISRYRGSTVDTAEAQLLSTSSPDFNCPSNRLDVTIVFNIPGGGWRGPYVEQNIGSEPVNSTAGVASTLPIVDSLIRVTGVSGFTRIELVDLFSGSGLVWDSGTNVIPAGKFLLIDPYNMRAVRKASNDWDMSIFEADYTKFLAYFGEGPFTITPRREGPDPTATALIGATVDGFAPPPVVRARSIVA